MQFLFGHGNSAINIKYGWKVSEDGRSVTTEFLKPLSINPYTGVYGLSYQEISIECIVNTDKTDELKRFVNIAQIAEGSGEDIDSIPGNITGPVDSDYMKEESQNSDENSYIVGTEDDNDFESIIVSNNMPVKYSFRINKIDEIDKYAEFAHIKKGKSKEYYLFLQYILYTQWMELKQYANEKNVQIIGDMPMYPVFDSVETRYYPEYFEMKDGKFTFEAGTPPDYFNQNGQKWNSPVYNVENIKKDKYKYLTKRFK